MDTDKLKNVSRSLEQKIEEGIQWVSKNLPSNEQKSVILKLKKHRRDNRRYRNAIEKRPVACLFGESQVGKSYAVTNIATTEDRTTFYVKNPETNAYINFLQEINPEGQGREATGVVTRFTVENSWQKGLPPFKLKLLSQTDVVKIIANSYFSDFQGINFSVNRDNLLEKIAEFKLNLRKEKTDTVFSEDNIYELKEYLEQRFPDKSIISDLRQMEYWDEIVPIMSHLSCENRCELLKVLWGEIEYFSELFLHLSNTLDSIQNENVVYVGQEVIAPKSASIVDVQRLNDIYNDGDKIIVNVVSEKGVSYKVNRGVLSAITLELVLLLPEYLKERENRKFLNHIDILDFPGARSRKKVEYDAFLQNSDELKTEMFLRGKVAYLFEKYSYEIEISSLLFCMHDIKSEVTDLPHFLYGWIRSNMGASAELRAKFLNEIGPLIDSGSVQINPLFVILTKYNNNLVWQDHTDRMEVKAHNFKWEHRINDFMNNFLTEPVDDKWVKNWTGVNQGFKNTFLLRDPLYSKTVFDELETKKINEDGVLVESSVMKAKPGYQPLYAERMEVIKESFLSHPSIKAHFHNPEDAWNESSTPGKTGMSYILKYLEPVSNPIIRITKLEFLIVQLLNTVTDDLSKFYDEGDYDKKLKEAKINSAKLAVTMLKYFKEQRQFGGFLRQLLIEEDEAWKAYWNFRNAKYDEKETVESSKYSVSNKEILESIGHKFDDSISFYENYCKAKDYLGFTDDEMLSIGIDCNVDIQEVRKEPSDYLSDELISMWLIKMDQVLTENEAIRKKSLDKEIVSVLIDNLKESKNRLDMAKTLSLQLRPHIDSQASNINYNIVPYISTRFINTFVYNAGNAFHFPVVEKASLPVKDELESDKTKSGMILFEAWKGQMMRSFTENVLYKSTVKDEEKLKNNAILGAIIDSIKQLS